MDAKAREDSIVLTDAWERNRSILSGYWTSNKQEYLTQLRRAHERRPKEDRSLAVGDICLVSDPSPSRSHWPPARVINTFGGERTDLRHRSCLVRIAGKNAPVKRPISMLFPLYIWSKIKESDYSEPGSSDFQYQISGAGSFDVSSSFSFEIKVRIYFLQRE